MDTKSQRILEFDKVREQLTKFTNFSAGESLARNTEPTGDLHEARRRQLETQEARLLFDKRSDITIGGARDMREQAANAKRGILLQPDELINIRNTITAARDIRRKIVKTSDTVPNLASIAELIEECPGIVSSISETFDERGLVVDHASKKLAGIRRDLRIIHERIQEKLRALIGSSNNQYLQEPTITTRSGRYVVPLMANHKGKIKGIIHDQSNSGATLWIEPMNTVELNNDYRGKQLAEEEEVRRILAELSAQVAVHSESIIRIVERMAELDLVFARARYADSIDATMPNLVAWREINEFPDYKGTADPLKKSDDGYFAHPGSTVWIRGARHPLLDPESVVPIDLLLDGNTFIVLITGPNTGGKTVSLKTMGLMALMAQSGFHLPAIEARLTIFDNIFADIGDEQSIEQNLSTFSGHLKNINKILEEADDRSLVLLDELGAGTDPTEGAALAQAITSYLHERGATTFVATHYPELKIYASQTVGVTNASLMFDVETLMPTFEMSIGMPGRSNALAIARRLGLKESILDEAMLLVGAQSHEAENLLDSIYELREQISSQEAGTRLALSQASEKREHLAERLENIEHERVEILNQVRRKAEDELKSVRRELRQIRRQIRDARSLNKLKKLQKQTEDIEDELSENIQSQVPVVEQPAKLHQNTYELQVGDTVLVTSLGVKGKIVGIDDGEAELAVGRLHMKADLDELKFKSRENEIEEEIAENNQSGFWKTQDSPGMELDLRGKRVDEGLKVLEKYIDSAFLAQLPWVRIIHGKGTGQLRKNVRKALERNGQVSSWEEGRDGEGGPGVTVAKLSID